jgi:electron transfer flavoprotein alpha subunit
MTNEVWTLSEQKDNHLREVSFELLAWGRKLADIRKNPLCSVVFADDMPETEFFTLIQQGADKVYVVQNPAFANFLVEPHVQTMKYLVNLHEPEIILAAATTTGRTVMPYLAMQLHTGLTADCTGLEIDGETGDLFQIRPAIGGNIMATIKTPHTRPQMTTVRPKSISALDPEPSRTGETIRVDVPEDCFKSRVHFEKFTGEGRSSVGLEEANIVVSAGISLQSEGSIQKVKALATTLGAALGSSRPPVDQGLQPYKRQVGLSGRTISPHLYVACGISGAVQHLAGIQTAKAIAAINNDPGAPVFQVADFGIVGDANQILPILIKHIENDL